jgi:hypothetical protein
VSSCSSHRMGAQSRVVGKLAPKASSQRFSRPDQASLHWASRDSFEAANKHKRIHQVDPLINIMNGSPYKNPYSRYFLREVGSGFCAVNPLESLAPRVGFEPTTLRLTAECSTVELPRSVRCYDHYYSRPAKTKSTFNHRFRSQSASLPGHDPSTASLHANPTPCGPFS